MMVGYCLKQILHLQGEFERYTDFYWYLIAIYTRSNERSMHRRRRNSPFVCVT